MHWRKVREADLLECLRMQPRQLGDDLVTRECALHIWKRLIWRRAFTSCVVECQRQGGQSQIVGFGSSVFVSEAFAAGELNEMRPGLNSRLMAAIARGEHIVPDDGELCPGIGADGLDMVILGGNYLTTGMSPEDVREVEMLLPSAFVECFTGFRLNRIVCETLSDNERKFNESSGVWRTIQHFPDQRALMILTREDAFSVSGSMAASLFAYQEPTLGLRDVEKELLAAALRGGTDDELAERLHLSRSSIKKRWQSLFDRVAETRSDLLPKNGSDGIARGPQKRHRILTYVRTHPSEVRPFDWHGDEW